MVPAAAAPAAVSARPSTFALPAAAAALKLGLSLRRLPDCYYAQVEAKRLGIPRDVPLAVQQWCVAAGC